MSEAEPKASADYFRKLHQQLVQKDNIIKLLQLQVKNLEGAGSDGAAVERLTQALAEAEARLAEIDARDAEPDRSEELGRRVAELEDELETLRTTESDGKRLQAQLSLREEELARLRDSLRAAEGRSREAEDLRDQLAVGKAALERMEKDLGKAREEAAAGTRRRGAAAPAGEAEKLREQVKDLEAALEVARAALEKKAASQPTLFSAAPALALADGRRGPAGAGVADTFRLRQAVIEGLQAVDDQRAGLTEPGEALEALGTVLAGVASALGLERIPTVGTPFDGKLHVLGRVCYADQPAHDSVVAEELAGWRADGAVVKPAQVSVVRNPSFCERCRVASVTGASFCHQCGSKLARPAPGAAQGLPSASPRSEGLRALDLARGLLGRGERKAAREAFAKARGLPADPRPLLGLATCDEDEGHFDAAMAKLAELSADVAKSPEAARARDRLAAKVEIVARLRAVR